MASFNNLVNTVISERIRDFSDSLIVDYNSIQMKDKPSSVSSNHTTHHFGSSGDTNLPHHHEAAETYEINEDQ